MVFSELVKSRWFVFTLTCWAFTPLVLRLAYLESGNQGINGAWLFPLVPFLVRFIVWQFKDIINQILRRKCK